MRPIDGLQNDYACLVEVDQSRETPRVFARVATRQYRPLRPRRPETVPRYRSKSGSEPPPPSPRKRDDGPNPLRDAFRGGGASGREGRDDDPITPEEFERLRGGGGGGDGGGGSEPDFDRYRGTVSGRRGRRGRY